MARILFVEDEPRLLAAYQRIMRETGHDCNFFSNAMKAYDIDQTSLLPYDLLITDYQLETGSHNWNGVQLIQCMKERRGNDFPCIMIASAEPPGKNPADVFMSKPFNKADLFAAIDKLLAR
ncbi:MAG: response regulator [Parcubacteria group bacterium]